MLVKCRCNRHFPFHLSSPSTIKFSGPTLKSFQIAFSDSGLPVPLALPAQHCHRVVTTGYGNVRDLHSQLLAVARSQVWEAKAGEF